MDNETGGLWGADYVDAMGRSKCGLNLSREREGPFNLATPQDLHVYSSDRVASLTGNGVLAFTHTKFDLDILFSEEEMVFYNSNDEAHKIFEKFMQLEDHKMTKVEIIDAIAKDTLKEVKAPRFYSENCDFVPFMYLSSGVKSLYYISIDLFLACSKKEKGILFIDDLTKKVSEECLEIIIEYCRENNAQLIYS